MAATLPGFDPRMVPEVAAGRFWLASAATGLGSSSFRAVEGNGNSAWDMLPTSATAFPTTLTENGGTQLRMRKSVDAAPSIITTAAAVQAGWTGDTCVAGWFRLPDASGDITGTTNLFVHTPTAAGQRRFSVVAAQSTDRISTTVSNDGTATVTNTWASPFTGGWLFIVQTLTVGVAIETSSDLTQLAHIVTATPGTPLFDGNTPAFIGCRAAATLANIDTTDWAAVYYCNGIPNLFNLQRLMAHQAPKVVSFV